MRFVLFLVLSVLLPALPAQAGDDAPVCGRTWTVTQADSSLKIRGKQMADDFEASFSQFDVDICYDPEKPENAQLKVVVKTNSFTSGSADRDSTAMTKEWFGVKGFPEAVFIATGFRKKEGGGFEAPGTLRIKETEQPVTLDFTLYIQNEESLGYSWANAQGSAVLDRSRFALGTGDWADASIIANNVTVEFSIRAHDAAHKDK